MNIIKKTIFILLAIVVIADTGVRARRRISLVDINYASVPIFMKLPGINEELAGNIIKYRKEKGYFEAIEDIKKTEGITEDIFKEIKPYLTLTPPDQIKSEKQVEDYQEEIERLQELEESGEVDITADIADTDRLERYLIKPLNLNTAARAQLLYLPEMTVPYAEAIIKYRRKKQGIEYLSDLKEVIPQELIEEIKPYVKIVAPGEEVEEFHGDFKVKYTLRDYPFSSGYLATDPAYHNPAEIYSRSRIYYGNKAEVGLVLRRDDGSLDMTYNNIREYFILKKYLFMRNVMGMDVLAIGNYELSFGQGLALYTRSGWGSLPKKPKGVEEDDSEDTNKRFYGVAASKNFGSLELSGFYSKKPIVVDSINEEDGSIGDRVVKPLSNLFGNKTLSYYQPGRFSNMGYLNDTFYGTRLKYALTGSLVGGVLAYSENFDHIIDPTDSDGYINDKYVFRGDRVDLYSVDFEYMYRNLRQFVTLGLTNNHIFTRSGSDSERKWKTGQGRAWESLSLLTFSEIDIWLNYHFIEPDYYAFHSSPLHSIYGLYRNEEGSVLGVEYDGKKVEAAAALKYGRYVVQDMTATELQTDELTYTLKLRYDPVKTVEIYFYNQQKVENKREEDVKKEYIDYEFLEYNSNKKKIQITYTPTDRGYLKWGFDTTDAGFKEINLTREEYPKYTLFTKVRYKPTPALTLYSKFNAKYNREGTPNYDWNINPKLKLSKYAKVNMTYRYHLIDETHEYRIQYELSW
ncbi:MAG: helix-hairpin-helix domain-containing protein [Elusimicrobia bacterium]|nr:helix-hairpin-helix domain-containing protein [Elusimicrobiota bacterium]